MIFSTISQHKRNSFKFYAGVSLAFFMLSHQSTAQELGLDNFVQSILQNSPGVQKILAEQDIASGLRDASLGINDGTISTSLNISQTEPNKIYGLEPNLSKNNNLTLAYNRLFSETGTRLSLAYNNLYTDVNPVTLLAGSQYYQPSITVKLTQPLLKNAGGIQDSLNIKLSEINYQLSVFNSQENLENYISQLVLLYLDWYLASQELKISKEVHLQSIEQEKLTRTKVNRQVIEPYELLRAQELREDYYSRLQQAQGRFSGLTQQIKYQMNSDSPLIDKNLVPTNPSISNLFLLNKHKAREENYLTNSSRLKSILDALNEQQLIVLDAKDNAKASDLNLSVGYTRHSVDQDIDSAALNKDDYSIMLEYKHLLGNRNASGDFQSQLAKKQQVEYDTQQRLIDAQANLESLKIQSSQLKISLESVDRKILLGKQKLVKEQRLFRIGKLDLFELLKDQTSHLESRLNRERLLIQHLSLQLNIGELLDQNLETYATTLKTEASSAIKE
ncbi:MAG: TolC family protein [Gammaproteobacteria bacterium]|nr:TolC family protein [Gammaproteobacteria bacterium]